MNKYRSEKGNVFTVLLAAVGLAGLLGTATYNLMSGPVASISRVSSKGITDADLLAAARITIMQAATQPTGGDCDSDGFLEPPPFIALTQGPVGGGTIDPAIGAPIIDAWGTSLGYCVWDIGPVTDDAGCTGPGANRLDGTNDPLSGETVSQTLIAFISAGPDRQFGTTCQAYVDGTTALISTGTSDDIALTYSYAAAAGAAPSIWKLKAGDPTTGELTSGKDAKIGGNVTLDSSSGAGSFTAVTAQGLMDAGYGSIVGDSSTVDDTECADSNDAGLIRYTADTGDGTAGIEFCDGTDWTMAGNTSAGGDSSDLIGFWERDVDDNIHNVNEDNVIVGINTNAQTGILKIAGGDDAMSIRNISNCGLYCGATLNISNAHGSEASPAIVTASNRLGALSWTAFGSSYTPAAEIVATAMSAPLSPGVESDIAFKVQGAAGQLRTPLTIKGDGKIGIGTETPEEQLHILQTSLASTPTIVNSFQKATNNSTTSSSSFLTGPTSGNYVIVAIACHRTTAAVCTVTGVNDGAAYTQAAVGTTGGRVRTYIYYRKITATSGTPLTVTVTASNANTNYEWAAVEVTNLVGASVTNASRRGVGAGTTANSSVTTSGSNTAIGDFTIAIRGQFSTDDDVGFAAGNGTQIFVQQDGDSALAASVIANIASTAGAYTQTWINDAVVAGTATGGSHALVTFAAAAPSGITTPHYVALGTHANSASASSRIALE